MTARLGLCSKTLNLQESVLVSSRSCFRRARVGIFDRTIDYGVQLRQKEDPHFGFDIEMGRLAGLIRDPEAPVVRAGFSEIPPRVHGCKSA